MPFSAMHRSTKSWGPHAMFVTQRCRNRRSVLRYRSPAQQQTCLKLSHCHKTGMMSYYSQQYTACSSTCLYTGQDLILGFGKAVQSDSSYREQSGKHKALKNRVDVRQPQGTHWLPAGTRHQG